MVLPWLLFHKLMKKVTFKTIFRYTLPVMTGYLVLGMGYGIYSTKSGYGFWWVLGASVFVYAGSMQFVLVELLKSQASFITTCITTLMVNARHLFYGISMIDRYKGAGNKKLYLIHSLTDETYSLLCNDMETPLPKYTFYFLVSLFDHLYWIIGSVLGAIIGQSIAFNSAGIEFSMTALFVSVFVEQWLSTKNHLPSLIGLVGSIVCLLLFGQENFLIPSMILIGALLLGSKQYNERRIEDA